MGALGAPYWEVRNAATLCLTALVVRVLGFKNAGKWESTKKSITGESKFEFWAWILDASSALT